MQPITYLRELCVYPREGMDEALTAAHVARAMEHRKFYHVGRRDSELGRRQHVGRRYGEAMNGPTVSKNSWTHVRTLSGPGRSPSCPAVVRGRLGKAEDADA